MATLHTRLTDVDLAELPDDGKRYELIEGELIVSPAPVPAHQRAVSLMDRFLGRAEEAGYGRVYIAPVEVRFDAHNVIQPDALFIRTARLHIVTETRIEGAPDLVIEVLLPSTRSRDLRAKRQLYERFGVPFYWVLDPGERTVQPHELTDRGYVAQPLLHPTDTLGCALFPDVTTRVDRLFH